MADIKKPTQKQRWARQRNLTIYQLKGSRSLLKSIRTRNILCPEAEELVRDAIEDLEVALEILRKQDYNVSFDTWQKYNK